MAYCTSMKALILAGGAGTRLRPITYTSAKQLVPVANRPILFYGIDALVAAGITDIGVIVGETRREVMAALGDGAQFGCSITYIPQDSPAGLAHCVLIARDFLGDDQFVMFLGDNLLEQDLGGFIRSFQDDSRRAAARILLKPVDDPQRFGIAELDGSGNVIALVEKPEHPPSNLALVGVYLFDQRIHQAVAGIQPSQRGELEITDAIQRLIDDGEVVTAELLTGWWIDTGKLTPLLEANRLILDRLSSRIDGEVDNQCDIVGEVVIEAGARVVRSRLRGPLIVGRDTVVIDSFIGPHSAIGAGCRIERSEVEHSVVMDGSVVLDIDRLEDSLIGREAEITRSKLRPRALRLMVGDHCQIDVE